MCLSSNMALEIRPIVVFLVLLETILAAHILNDESFGIIGQNSDNFPEGEKIELKRAKDFVEHVLNIINISGSSSTVKFEIDGVESTIIPEGVEVIDKDAGGNSIRISSSTTDSSTKFSNISEPNSRQGYIFKTNQLTDEQNLNGSDRNSTQGIWTRMNDEISFTNLTNDNSIFTTETSYLVAQNGKNMKHSTVEGSMVTMQNPNTESKTKKNFDQNVGIASESVVKNVIQPKLTKNVKLDIDNDFEKVNRIEDKWRDLEKTFRLYTDSVMKKALPKFLRIHSQLNISSQCNGAFLQLVSGLRKFKSWAVKMVDASGRLPSGTMEGTLTDLGDYDQCLDVVQPKKAKHMSIQGQYCTLEVQPVLPALHNSVSMNTKVLDFGNISTESVLSDLSHGSALFHLMVMRIGVCVPSPCVADDIQAMAAAILKKVPVEVHVRNCEVKQESHVTIPQFIVLSMAAVIVVLIFAGTFIESYVSRNGSNNQDMGRVPQSLLAFSLTLNLKQLLKSSRKNSTLGAVNGVRCLSLLWIVLAHTYGFGHRQGLARLSHAKTYMDDIFFQIITNSWVSVDTFFLLGGLLVATSNLKIMEGSGGKINYFSRLFHRIWRLTPPLAATVGVMFVLPLIGSGPLWADMAGQKVLNCEKRWWQVFLPVNTWVDFSSMCLLHTWYVASDVHFYCLAPIALSVLYRWPAAGFAFLFVITAACAFITGLLTIIHNLPPTVIFFSPDIELTKKTANLVYFRPYPHVGAYCVGLALGYLLWKYHKWSLTKMTQSIGWAVSATSCLAVLFATYSWSRGIAAEAVVGVIYAVLHRTAWAAGVAWVLFICAIGQGGILNKFLSWQLFTPLSRLCYSVYLLHFPVLWVRISWRRTLLPFHHYDLVTEFLGVLMITLALSFLFHLAFEAPFVKLEQIWFPERSKPTEVKKPLEDKHTT